ncbi:ABC transporter ATP-binding protein [Myxococcota bacterium]|nr:ABC transporter ATP-binding protein [Myxococcota bacterium]
MSSPTSTPALALCAVTKDYGRIRAVDGLSLEVPEGSLFGLIGPNGAGKTTTFGLLSGFLHPTKGDVLVRGRRLGPGQPPVGHVLALPQDANLPERMKVTDVLVMLGRLGGLGADDARARARAALARVGLAELAERKVGALSHGQRRRVGIAQTLIGDGEVILLDEPTAGLDARSAAELRQLIEELRGERTIVLSSHNLQEVEALCDRAAIIDKGHLVAVGTMAELKSSSTLVRVVLAKALALEVATGVMMAVRALPGVKQATLRDDAAALDLELGEERDGDITSAVLRTLLERGVAVGGVERGKSLEQRFLEETRA